MATHISRDYNIQTAVAAARASTPLYILAIVLRRVLGWTVVGQTGFDIDGALLTASGTLASINTLGAGAEYKVVIPSGQHTVSTGNIGKILCLKSTANPLKNSGAFLITAADTTNNAYTVDWRSTDLPPAETSAIDWSIFLSDANAPTLGAANSGSGYRGNGTSTTPRLILQSPHAMAHQVRLCVETSNDVTTNNTCPVWSVAPGFGGNSSGDFPVGGSHLHGALYFNAASQAGQGGSGWTIGGGDKQISAVSNQRIYVVGNTEGQGAVVIVRRPSGSTAPAPYFVAFGIPDNEPTPLPTNLARLFVIGGDRESTAINNGTNLNGIRYDALSSASAGGNQGVSSGVNGGIVSCCFGCWQYSTAVAASAGPVFEATAADSPFIGSTELLSVDVVAGTIQAWYTSATGFFAYEPRILGTMPWMRQGRANLGNFVTTTDAGKAWLHMDNGVYLTWGGPASLP